MIFCKKREADQDHTKHLKDRFPISTALLLISFHALAKVQPLSLVDLQTHPGEGQLVRLIVRRKIQNHKSANQLSWAFNYAKVQPPGSSNPS